MTPDPVSFNPLLRYVSASTALFRFITRAYWIGYLSCQQKLWVL